MGLKPPTRYRIIRKTNRNPVGGGPCGADHPRGRGYVDVSENRGVFPPNHPLKNRVFHYFHPFWGTRIFGNTHVAHAWVFESNVRKPCFDCNTTAIGQRTLPKTYSSPLKMGHPKRKLVGTLAVQFTEDTFKAITLQKNDDCYQSGGKKQLPDVGVAELRREGMGRIC